MPFKLHNSLTREDEELRPIAPPEVGLYTCGPTVYNYLHVGNYRTYVFEDALRRALELHGWRVRHVMNITDVGHLASQADEGEDKMEQGARREGKTAWEIAEFYKDSFIEESAKLNLLPPRVLCRATDHIPEQIELVRRLEEKGFTYRTSDGIYFDTTRFKGYGRLIGKAHLEGLEEGARVQSNPEKRGPTDFALWKFAPAETRRQMEWDSPWGRGFPGWHIECSAMAMKYLGETFDIHCGGVDHIPIHHTNEIAQSEAATGKPFVRVWLHGEFLVLNKAKMAKSSGSFIRLKDLADKGLDPLDYRYFCFTAHYRKQLEFSWEALMGAKTARARLREKALELQKRAAGPDGTAKGGHHFEQFKARIGDDLDMPGALAVIWNMLSDKSISPAGAVSVLMRAEEVLGLKLLEGGQDSLTPEQTALFDSYVQARARKDYSSSDILRKRLAETGIRVLDTPDGSRWKRA